MTSFSRKRYDRAKRARAKGGRTPDILRKSGPHVTKPRKHPDLLRNNLQNWEIDDNE